MDAKITAIICTYDRYDLLPKAIDSLKNQLLPDDAYRIVIVDNSPDQEAAQQFGKRYLGDSAISYRLEAKPGLSNARNVAAQSTDTEFLCYMDDDAIASEQWLGKILEAFEVFGPDTAVVGGKVDPIWEVPRPQWLHDHLVGFVSVVDWGGDARIAAPTEYFAGTNVAYRTRDLLEFGAFATGLGRIGNSATLLSNEELELTNRIRASGKLLVYSPESVVNHLVPADRLSQSWYRKRVAWQAVSDFLMDSGATADRSAEGWERLLDYFNDLPPRARTVRGLFVDTDDPVLFQRQLDSIQSLIINLLDGRLRFDK